MLEKFVFYLCFMCFIYLTLFFNFVAALFVLQRDMEARRRFAFRPGTVANHRTHLHSFIRFCIYFNLVDLPASGNTLSLFTEFLTGTYSAPNSIFNALSSVRFYHNLLGFSTVGFEDFQFQLTKRALPRSVRFEPNPALPITVDILKGICEFADTQGVMGVAFKTLCVISFHTLARLSSLVPSSRSKLDCTRTVLIEDVLSTQNGFEIIIKWSKVQQFLSQKLTLPLVEGRRQDGTCPAVALSKLLVGLLPGAPVSTPLFAWRELIKGVPKFGYFTIPLARLWLRRALSNVGLDDGKYTFHSFRRGGCQYGYLKGADVGDLKFLGGWNSDAIQSYLPVAQGMSRAANFLAS